MHQTKFFSWKMYIQRFDCIIEHVPGHLNVITDGGSRLAAPLKLNNLSSLNDIQFEGYECEGVGESSHYTGDSSRRVLEEYNDSSGSGESLSVLFSNMFLETKTKSDYSLSALSRGTMPVTFANDEVKLKFLSNERYDFIEQYHNIKIGHGGRDRTIRLIKERSNVKDLSGLERDVSLFIRYCPLCQMMKIQNLKAKILPF